MKALPPCRALCEKARSGCEHIMQSFGFPWPENLDCARFPATSDLCVTGDVSADNAREIPNFSSHDMITPLTFYPQKPSEFDLKSGKNIN